MLSHAFFYHPLWRYFSSPDLFIQLGVWYLRYGSLGWSVSISRLEIGEPNWLLCSRTDIQKAASHSRRHQARPWISRSMGLESHSSVQSVEITVFTLWILMERNLHRRMGLRLPIFSTRLYLRLTHCKWELITWFWPTSRQNFLISITYVTTQLNALDHCAWTIAP